MGVAIVAAVAALVVGLVVGLFLRRMLVAKSVDTAEARAAQLVSDAEHEAEIKVRQALLEVRDEISATRQEAEEDLRVRREVAFDLVHEARVALPARRARRCSGARVLSYRDRVADLLRQPGGPVRRGSYEIRRGHRPRPGLGNQSLRSWGWRPRTRPAGASCRSSLVAGVKPASSRSC